ncbi:MAG: hypothetical protein ACI97A_002860 [Planctomycetota bacterium]|jgi:hypothetical protein
MNHVARPSSWIFNLRALLGGFAHTDVESTSGEFKDVELALGPHRTPFQLVDSRPIHGQGIQVNNVDYNLKYAVLLSSTLIEPPAHWATSLVAPARPKPGSNRNLKLSSFTKKIFPTISGQINRVSITFPGPNLPLLGRRIICSTRVQIARRNRPSHEKSP